MDLWSRLFGRGGAPLADLLAGPADRRIVRWFLPRGYGLLARSPGVEEVVFRPL